MASFVTFTRKGPDPATLIADINKNLTRGMKAVGTKANKAGVAAFKAAAGIRSFGHRPVGGGSYPMNFKVKKSTSTPTNVHLHFQASPVGFWVIAESGAAAHKIVPKKKYAKKAVSWGTSDETVSRSVDHPGAAGHGAYSRGEAAAIEAVNRVIETDLVAEVTRGG